MNIKSDYLSPKELEDLTGYKANRRSDIAEWLESNKWVYVLNKNGLPMVLREYRDIKLGLNKDGKKQLKKQTTEPNFMALGIG